MQLSRRATPETWPLPPSDMPEAVAEPLTRAVDAANCVHALQQTLALRLEGPSALRVSKQVPLRNLAVIGALAAATWAPIAAALVLATR